MWSTIKDIAKGLLKSKKFFLTVVSIIVWVVGKTGLLLDEATVTNIVYALWVLVGGIALQDFGKEAKKLEPPA